MLCRVSGGSGIYESAQLPNLGELEARVLELLWDAGGWMTTRDVMEFLDGQRELAYTTVMTILVKLWKKGLVERTRDGRAYAYHPLLTREEWTARRMGELLAVAENRAEALSHFVSGIDQRDISQLRRILRSEK
jgi:predicted transcriptional regulator